MEYLRFVQLLFISCIVLTLFQHAQAWKNIPDEFRELGNVHMKNCLAKVPISEDTVWKARDHIFPEHGSKEEELYKCYLKCAFEEMGIWKNGMVDYIKAQADFPETIREKYRPNHVNCKDTRGKDECDTAYLTMECYKNTNYDIYFVI